MVAVRNSLTRQDLSEFLPNQRAIRAFEETFQAVDVNTSGVETAQSTANSANTKADEAVQATSNIRAASILVLSPDSTLTNERVLTAGNLIAFNDTGGEGTLTVSVDRLSITNSFDLDFTLSGNSALTLPTSGTLATLAGVESLSNKTLNSPSITGLGNYASDAAAAGGGVPIGGIYRNGSVLRVRVT